MSMFGQPSVPNAMQVAQQQQQFNQQAAQQQQKMNMVGQQTPYGSLTWNKDPNAPGGFTATTALSPQQQALLNLQFGGQAGTGAAGVSLGQDIAGMFGAGPPNLDPTAMTNQLMNWQTQSMQPYWDIQQSNLQTQLANQGLNPNDPAYQNAMMAFTKGIGQARNQFFAQAEPLAFQQQIQKYQAPIGFEQSLLGMGKPQGPSFVSTPQEQIQPANYQAAAQQQFQNQQQQYQNMMQGIGQAASIGMAPFTGGMSLFGAMPMFSGGWAGSPNVTGGSF